jgi:hypothetical protein
MLLGILDYFLKGNMGPQIHFFISPKGMREKNGPSKWVLNE